MYGMLCLVDDEYSSFHQFPSNFYQNDYSQQYHEIKEQEQSTTHIIKKSNKIKKETIKRSNPIEAKNIPKNLGGLLKKFYIHNHSDLVQSNEAIHNFVTNGKKNKNITRDDLETLFNDVEASRIAAQYYSGFDVIQDLIKSEKIPDVAIHIKYLKKLFIGTQIPTSLQSLKIN